MRRPPLPAAAWGPAAGQPLSTWLCPTGRRCRLPSLPPPAAPWGCSSGGGESGGRVQIGWQQGRDANKLRGQHCSSAAGAQPGTRVPRRPAGQLHAPEAGRGPGASHTEAGGRQRVPHLARGQSQARDLVWLICIEASGSAVLCPCCDSSRHAGAQRAPAELMTMPC